jgi:hypothetical protein
VPIHHAGERTDLRRIRHTLAVAAPHLFQHEETYRGGQATMGSAAIYFGNYVRRSKPVALLKVPCAKSGGDIPPEKKRLAPHSID